MPRTQSTQNQTEASEVKVKAFPFTTRKVRHSLGAPMLMGLGCLLAVFGGMWAFAPESMSGMERFLSSLESGQIAAGDLMLGGVLCFALGMIGRYPRAMANSMIELDQTEQAVTELSADMVECSNLMQEMRDDQLQARSEVHSLSAKIREWSASENSGEANDALYRLAASLDQLHAQIDRRLSEVTHVIEGRVAEVFQLVEASRDFLQESIEENSDRAERIERNVGEVLEAVASIEIPTSFDTDEVGELAAPTYESVDPFSTPACETEGNEFGMSIMVDFEPEGTPLEPAPELGLLDDVSDDPSMWEIEAENARLDEATQEYAEELASGLNLLDDPMTDAPAQIEAHTEVADPPAALPCEPSSETEDPVEPMTKVSNDTSVPNAVPMTGPIDEPRAPLPSPASDVCFDTPPYGNQDEEVTEINLDSPPPFPGSGEAPQPPNYPY
jgi:hypothetical protein